MVLSSSLGGDGLGLILLDVGGQWGIQGAWRAVRLVVMLRTEWSSTWLKHNTKIKHQMAQTLKVRKRTHMIIWQYGITFSLKLSQTMKLSETGNRTFHPMTFYPKL